MKTLLAALCLVATLVCGCANGKRLESGGAYAPVTTNQVGEIVVSKPEVGLFALDIAFNTAYNALNIAFNSERDNRAVWFAKNPNVKHSLDKIRPQAVDAVEKYKVARSVYESNRIPDNLSQVEYVIAEVQRLATSASAIVVNPPK